MARSITAHQPGTFTATDYYAAEMGENLQRGFIAFEPMIPADTLPSIKHETNAIEARIAEESLSNVPRPVNLDPGYLQLGKIVLASTKDAGHRLALGSGIYGELTLRFNTGAWEILPWTYPDFREQRVHDYFLGLREIYRNARRAWLEELPEAEKRELGA
jgi:hypothetical protein